MASIRLRLHSHWSCAFFPPILKKIIFIKDRCCIDPVLNLFWQGSAEKMFVNMWHNFSIFNANQFDNAAVVQRFVPKKCSRGRLFRLAEKVQCFGNRYPIFCHSLSTFGHPWREWKLAHLDINEQRPPCCSDSDLSMFACGRAWFIMALRQPSSVSAARKWADVTCLSMFWCAV